MGSRFATAAVAIAVALAVALSGATSAHAQQSAAKRSDELFQTALALYASGSYDAAAEAFATSYELAPRSDALFAWAQAERQAGDCNTAIELYESFLQSNPSDQHADAARHAMSLCPDPPEPAPEPQPEPELELELEEELDLEPDPEPVAASFRAAEQDIDSDAALQTSSSPATRSPLTAFARLDVDASGRGAVFAPGLTFAVNDRWDVFANGLLGGNRGVELGGRVALSSKRVRPYVVGSVPVFFVDGERASLRAAIGIRAQLVRGSLAGTFELGGAYAFSSPPGGARSVMLASVGVELPL